MDTQPEPGSKNEQQGNEAEPPAARSDGAWARPAEAVEHARSLRVTLPGGVASRGENAGRLAALVRALKGGGN
jgi:hypothetical protein